MKIICFGDSNTYGYDPRGYFGDRYDDPWPRILARLLSGTVINRGENGRQIPGGPLSIPEDAGLFIVMLGTNDLLEGASPEVVCGRMEQFLGASDPEKILLIAPPPMQAGAWVQSPQLLEASKTLAACFEALAHRLSICFADAGLWDIPLAYDGVHFTEQGHVIFAREILKIIQNLTGGSV